MKSLYYLVAGASIVIWWTLLVISDRLRQIDKKLGNIQENTLDPETERRKKGW